MPKPTVEPEEFQAWKDSPLTRWVVERLHSQAKVTTQAVQDQLWAQLAGQPGQWADSQAVLAHQRGQVEGVLRLVFLEYDDLLTEDEIEALKAEKTE